MVGHQGGQQILNLKSFEPGRGCFRLGTIMHEFLHGNRNRFFTLYIAQPIHY